MPFEAEINQEKVEQPIKEGKQEEDESLTRAEVVMKTEEELKNIPEQVKEKSTRKLKDIVSDCKKLEEQLGVKPKGLSKIKKEDAEKYLAKLMDQAGDKLVEEQILKPKTDIKKKEPNANEVRDAKTKIVEQTRAEMDKLREQKNNDELMSSGADALYRINMSLLFIMEKASVQFEDQYGTNLVGACKKIEGDYNNKESDLKRIYMQIYRDNKEIIDTYASPVTQLAIYNIGLIGGIAAQNVKKK